MESGKQVLAPSRLRVSVHPVIAISIYMVVILCIELSKEFNTVGADNLRKYDSWQWSILVIGVVPTLGTTFLAFVDPSYRNYRQQKQDDKDAKD